MQRMIKAHSAYQCMQWTGGYAPRFQAFFVALSFFRLGGESCPTYLPLTPTVGRFRIAGIA